MGVPRLREQVSPEAEQLGIIAQFGRGLTAIGADVSARIANAVKTKEINKGLTDAKESWYDFLRELEKDNDYTTYGEKFDDYKQATQEAAAEAMKLPASRREFAERFESWAVDRREEVIRLADEKSDADIRSGLIRDINQAIVDLDEEAVNIRISEAVRDGIISPEEGEKARAPAIKQIRTDKVAQIARDKGYTEGIAWLQDNYKYLRETWELTDDEVNEIVKSLSFEQRTEEAQYEAFKKAEDEKLDTIFEDLYYKAETPDDVQKALDDLDSAPYFDGEKKYTQHIRLERLLQTVTNKANAETQEEIDAWEAFQKENLDLMEDTIVFLGEFEGLSPDSIFEIVADSYERGLLPLGSMEALRKQVYAAPDVALTDSITFLKSKGAGLTEEQKLDYVGVLRKWRDEHPDDPPEKVREAAKNLANQAILDTLGNLVRKVNYNLGGTGKLMPIEEMIMTVQAGGFTGIVELAEDNLDLLKEALIELAQREYRREEILTGYIDVRGELVGPDGKKVEEGTPVLLSDLYENRKYVWMVEDQEAVLYGRTQRRDGTFDWQKIGKAGTATTPAPLGEPTKPTAQALRGPLEWTEKEKQDYSERRMKQLRSIVPPPEPEKPVLAEWKKVAGRWVDRVTGEVASSEESFELDRQQAERGK